MKFSIKYMDCLTYFMSLGGRYYRNWKYQTSTLPASLAANVWLGLGQLDIPILDIDSKAGKDQGEYILVADASSEDSCITSIKLQGQNWQQCGTDA